MCVVDARSKIFAVADESHAESPLFILVAIGVIFIDR
jgi:hypothetical protein